MQKKRAEHQRRGPILCTRPKHPTRHASGPRSHQGSGSGAVGPCALACQTFAPCMIANFFQSLEDHRVEHLLISGQASVLYGAATFSEDVDLWINPTPH